MLGEKSATHQMRRNHPRPILAHAKAIWASEVPLAIQILSLSSLSKPLSFLILVKKFLPTWLLIQRLDFLQ
jgi:hypothetical protein